MIRIALGLLLLLASGCTHTPPKPGGVLLSGWAFILPLSEFSLTQVYSSEAHCVASRQMLLDRLKSTPLPQAGPCLSVKVIADTR